MYPLFAPDRPKQVRLRASLSAEEVASMLSLLKEFADVFVWSHADMPVVFPELAEHRLSMQDGFRPVRQRLRRLLLNPAKCMFAVSLGNFLGFLIHQRGIEMSPGQVRAITQMQPLTTKKEIQALYGRLTSLNKFISR